MKRQILAMILGSALLSPLVVTATEPQSMSPKKPTNAHNHRDPKSFLIENGDSATITLFKPDLSSETLTAEMGKVTMPRTGVDNYHALVVEKQWGNYKEAIIHYQYMFGRPSHQSPDKLIALEKTEFEIIPEPLPREHYRYHSMQEWEFRLRFNGAYLSGQPLTLNTSNGSQQTLTTDENGRVTFTIPDDFPDLVDGVRDRRNAQFTIISEYQQDKVTYSTQLFADYQVNPNHWQSTQLGFLVLGIGFLAGGYLGHSLKSRGEKT
ncbi:MAG: Ig-like domain-containing protein [Candidatus Thiodiazotropha sp. 6PLUC5]